MGAMCQHLQAVSDGRITKLIINVPPRSSKSNIVSILWPTWEWTYNPGMRWVFASYNDRLSVMMSQRRREVILSEWYQVRWGDKVQLSKDQREKVHFKNTSAGQMFSTSVGAKVTGFGGNRLVLDDPQDPEGAESDLVRESTISWLNSTFPSRKDSMAHAREVLIQQRLHELDATGLYEEQGGWDLLKIPMEYSQDRAAPPTSLGWVDPRTADGTILDERRWPRPQLEDLKKRLGPYGCAGQLDQEPSPHGGAVIKEGWLKRWVRYEPGDGTWRCKADEYEPNPFSSIRFMTIDPATSEKDLTKNITPDYFVIAVWMAFRSHRGCCLYLLDLLRDRLEGPDQEARIQSMQQHWKVSVIGVETIGYQLNLFQRLKRMGLPVREMSNKLDDDVLYRIDKDKLSRALAATPMMSDGRFYIPDYAPWLADYVKELTRFPHSEKDDMVDVTSAACAIAEKVLGAEMSVYEEFQRDADRPRPAYDARPADRDAPLDPLQGYAPREGP